MSDRGRPHYDKPHYGKPLSPARELADRFHQRWLAENPFTATSYGIPGYDAPRSSSSSPMPPRSNARTSGRPMPSRSTA
jgi:hypothetical protein